jgi:hypothetical protein
MAMRPLIVVLAAPPMAPMDSSVEARKRPRTVTRTFRNTAPTEFPYSTTVGPTAATIYPSTIAVGGLNGTIRDINLTLHDFSFYPPRTPISCWWVQAGRPQS